jgi:hypothetical protein
MASIGYDDSVKRFTYSMRLAQYGALDVSELLTYLGETAAAIVNLDLVITIDTAVAHLAGALGRPVWVMLPTPADWRWLLDRADSPWYSSMRPFRQDQPGAWEKVVADVSAALRCFRFHLIEVRFWQKADDWERLLAGPLSGLKQTSFAQREFFRF